MTEKQPVEEPPVEQPAEQVAPAPTLEEEFQAFVGDLIVECEKQAFTNKAEEHGPLIRIADELGRLFTAIAGLLGLPSYSYLMIPAAQVIQAEAFGPEQAKQLQEQLNSVDKAAKAVFIEHYTESITTVSTLPAEQVDLLRALSAVVLAKAEQIEADAVR